MSHPLSDPLYYLDNFRTLLHWVAERYADLLTAAERQLIAHVDALPVAAQALLARLVMRKGDCFRVTRLDYPEITAQGSLADAINQLEAQGFIQKDPVLSLAEVFSLLTRAELARCLGKPAQGLKKAQWLASLAGQLPAEQPFSNWCSVLNDGCLRLAHTDVFTRLRLLFFGNLRQDYSDFVLADLGIFRFEKVAFTPESRGFQRRSDVDDYMAVHALREALESEGTVALETRQAAQLLTTVLANEWIEARRQRLLLRAAELLQKAGESERSLSMYERCSAVGARIKYIRLLERQGATEKAYRAALAASEAPANQAERQQLARVLPRLQRRLGLAVTAASPQPSCPEYHLELPVSAGQQTASVEHAAANALAEPGSQVVYVENTLINAIFGLVCWPAIFAPVSGAFFHPFHAGPADLLRADFVAKRRCLFDECLAAFDDGTYKARILACFDAKQGLQCPFVFWGGITRELLETALVCMPAAHLRHWCAWLLEDIKHNRAGFADLIQFWPERQRYRMIEVKGPGDRLQDNQRRMIAYCQQHAMPISVCWVRWAEPVT